MQISIAFKLTIFRFFNSTIVILGANSFTEPFSFKNWFDFSSKRWFDNGNLVDEIFWQIVLCFFTRSFFKLFYAHFIKDLKKIFYKSQKECKLTQLEANELCEGDEPDVPDILADYLNIIMVAMFYAPIFPLVVPLACAGLTIFYKIIRCLIKNKYKMPKT